MSQLRPCPHCSRHHRVCEPVCPFCGVTLPQCKGAPSPGASRGRMSRATLFAAGAALLSGAACDNRSTSVHYGLPAMTYPDAKNDASDSGAGDARAADDGETTQDVLDAKDGGAG
jgi:hypothetical protein